MYGVLNKKEESRRNEKCQGGHVCVCVGGGVRPWIELGIYIKEREFGDNERSRRNERGTRSR